MNGYGEYLFKLIVWLIFLCIVTFGSGLLIGYIMWGR